MKQNVRLGALEETLLVPLYARAIESRRTHPIRVVPQAMEPVLAIDWDFERFGQRMRVVDRTLRIAMFDEWIAEFLRDHPEGTVVEIGAGRDTRFGRYRGAQPAPEERHFAQSILARMNPAQAAPKK